MSHYVVADVDAPPLACVDADATIEDALERLFEAETRQVGVLEDGALVGVVSHREITRILHISGQIDQDDSLLDQPVTVATNRSYPRVRPDDELFVLFDELADAAYVVVESDEPRVLGDVTFHQFLQDEIEAFLLVEDVERTLRERIRAGLDEYDDDEDVAAVLADVFEGMDLRTPSRLEECSFRHYSILLSARWDDAFASQFAHRPDFVRELVDQVGEIRNRLVHFRESDDADPLDTDVVAFARDRLEAGPRQE